MGLGTWILLNVFKAKIKSCSRSCSNTTGRPPWKVLFFGTDTFSLFSLKILTEEYRIGALLSRLEVVTTMKGKPNPVRIFSEKENLCLHQWPPNIQAGEFDVGLVVSFGHLIPARVIENFQFGMLNVHASLLPRWRGAAPIIYAIASGDAETGTTIMQISPHKFDVGKIVHQDKIKIPPSVKMPELYTILGTIGAKNLVTVLKYLPENLQQAKPQPTEGITYAPKITPCFAFIKWDFMTAQQICNLERAVEGLFHLQTSWKGMCVKLMSVMEGGNSDNSKTGFVEYDKQKEVLKVSCIDLKYIEIGKVGVAGKRIMTAKDFNNGYVKKEPPDCRHFD